MDSLKSISTGVIFKNEEGIEFRNLKYFPKGIVFGNGGYLWFNTLESFGEDQIFSNGREIEFLSLEKIPQGTIFRNGGDVVLAKLGLEGFSKGIKFENTGIFEIRHNNLSNLRISGIRFARTFSTFLEQIYG